MKSRGQVLHFKFETALPKFKSLAVDEKKHSLSEVDPIRGTMDRLS